MLSDFWPHGQVASTYGVLRGDGVAERALFLIDKQGIIRWIYVEDINRRPPWKLLNRPWILYPNFCLTCLENLLNSSLSQITEEEVSTLFIG